MVAERGTVLKGRGRYLESVKIQTLVFGQLFATRR